VLTLSLAGRLLLEYVVSLVRPPGRFSISDTAFSDLLNNDPVITDVLRKGRFANQFHALCDAARDVAFHDGMDNIVSLNLSALIQEFCPATLNSIEEFVLDPDSPIHFVAEVLRCLGDTEHEGSRDERQRVLVAALPSTSHVVRDGSLAGLKALDDPRSVPALQKAAAREEYPALKRYMNDVLRLLESTSEPVEQQSK